MGGNWSKRSLGGWPAVRERMRRTRPAASTSSKTAATVDNAWLEAQEEEEVGFPVRPQVPLTPMTYKTALDLSHFLKEKGGLEGLIYSQERQDILDLWVHHTQGILPDWQNYTPGPGIRYPLTFGWCFKLVPVDPEQIEKTNLLMSQDEEVLMWKFDSRLAFHHMARELHPEYYKN
uniref:Protein Nef n=1 Tax=Human immunodeficiency virus type 1 TaxID=11676 RepID=A0A4Y5JWC1_HV1|nr:nef protein [Human immunodeficiency virus 1]